MCATTPIWLLIAVMFTLFVVLQASRTAAHTSEVKTKAVPQTSRPAFTDSGVAFAMRFK